MHDLFAQGYQPNNIAILSPITGNQFVSGLKRIANILDSQGINYVAYYDETSDMLTKKVKTKSKKNGINLLTIHDSKGLEYQVVILVRLQDSMMWNESYDCQHLVS